MRRRHRPAGRAEDQALEQGRRLGPSAGSALSRALAQNGLHPIPERAIDNGLMLARIGRALVHRLADVDPVVEQLVDVALVDGLALLAANAFRPQCARQRGGGTDLHEALEDHSDGRGFGLVDDQLAVLDVIAERHEPAHPHALLARGGELVPDALADDLALELGEGEQDVEGQPAHGGRGVEGLGDADEGDVVAIEHLDQLGKIHQRAAEPIDLVDDDDVDPPRLDIGDQSLQGGPLQRAAGEAAIVVAVGHQQPALGLLTGDIGLTGLALGIEAS